MPTSTQQQERMKLLRNHHGLRGEAGSRRWYDVKAAEGDDSVEILIYDEIGRGFFGGGIAAEDFIKDLKALKLKKSDTLLVRINSPGGDLFDGTAIYNYLRTVKSTVNVRVDGVAASAASIIAMAGDRIDMPENSWLFIHNPWMFAMGDSKVMRKAADDLDTIREGAIASYLHKAGDKLDRKSLMTMMDEETWLQAGDAVEVGLADAVDEPVRAAALQMFKLDAYGYPVPDQLQKKPQDLASFKARIEELSRIGT